MALSPNLIQGFERAHSLTTEWRNKGYCNGIPSDNKKMFEYVIHLEDEYERLEGEITSMQQGGAVVSAKPGKPAPVAALSNIVPLKRVLPENATISLKTLAAELEAAEETIAQLDQDKAQLKERIAELEAEVAKAVSTPVVSAAATRTPSEVVEALTQIRNLSEGALAVWQTQQADVSSFIEHSSSAKPKASMPVPPTLAKAERVEAEKAAKPEPIKTSTFAEHAVKQAPAPKATPTPAAGDSEGLLAQLTAIVKPWKKGVSIREDKKNVFTFSQKGEDFLIAQLKGDTWNIAGFRQHGVEGHGMFKRVKEAIQPILDAAE